MGYNGKKHLEWVQSIIDHGMENHEDFEENEISDGYHTFAELYSFRLTLQALLFNEWANTIHRNDLGNKLNPYDVHKSWKHHDEENCFPESKHRWFIVVAMLPSGQVTNHYKSEHWDKFKVPEAPKAKYEFDGHTAKDVLERLNTLL